MTNLAPRSARYAGTDELKSNEMKNATVMNKKSFLWGVLTGMVLTLVGLLALGLAVGASGEIEYLEKPVSYENKTETSFKVFQVLDMGALASEISDLEIGIDLYEGNTVVLQGKDFYNDQIVKMKNPQRVGTFSYTNNRGLPMTVPVIKGEINGEP